MKKNLVRIATFCQHCHMKCFVFAMVRNGKVERIDNTMDVEGAKSTPSGEVLYHPDRVVHPLKRIGKRGEGKWQRISWDEALETMTERFGEIKKKYGAEAISTIRGCGHKEMACQATAMFAHIMDTPNALDINHQCIHPLIIAEAATYGDNILADVGPDYKRSKCILIWGASPRHNRPAHERDINIARLKGAKLICVDPRPPERTDAFKLGLPDADIWLRVRPGTDAALALAMINVVIREELYNRKFVNKWCAGFEDFNKHVQEYTPERAEEITWVPKEKIVEAARLFAKTKPSCLHTRLGAGSQQVNATQTARAISILMVLAGNIDVPGGNLLSDKLGGFKGREVVSQHILRVSPEAEEKRIGAKEFPLVCGPRGTSLVFPHAHTPSGIKAMIDGRIRGLYIPGSNMVVMEGDSRQVWAALNNLDFLVAADFFMTPTAELADLVLPAAHWLETELPMRAYQVMGPKRYNYILAAQRVVEPRGECWDDRKIIIELAKRMGIKVPWENVEEFNDWQLEKVGVKFKDIQKKPQKMIGFKLESKRYEKEGFRFNTPSGKIELRSSILEKHGYDPLPHFIEPPQSPFSTPELAKEYPMILTNHRTVIYMHSEFRQLPSYRKVEPEHIIEINPQTAAEKGIKDGEAMFIERPGFKDRIAGKARFVAGLHPNVISNVPGWWYPEKPGPEHGAFASNINTIISNAPPYDPINGNYQIRAILCRVGKI